MIDVEFINNSHLKLHSDNGTLKHISEYFTFQSENAKWDPRFKAKVWDGKIRLFDARKRTLPCGLLPRLYEFASIFNYKINTLKSKDLPFSPNQQKISDQEIKQFIENLKLPFIPYDYQIKAFQHFVNHKRCLIESPTSSGKSLAIYIMARWAHQKTNKKVLIIVPTVGLVTQMEQDFVSYGLIDDVYTISAGVDKVNIPSNFIISTWQSLLDLPESWFDNIHTVIGDEVHLYEAKSLKKIVQNCTNAYYRAGLTGTFKDDDTKRSLFSLESLFGPARQYVTTKELIDRDITAKIKIYCLLFQYDNSEKRGVYGMSYHKEVEYLSKHNIRTNEIIKLAFECSNKGNVLLLFKHVQYGKELFDKLKKQHPEKNIYLVYGITEKDERELVRVFAEENDVIIVASVGVFSTGISIKRLHYLIFTQPNKSRIKVLQSIGRTLRKSPDEKNSVVFDIVDDLEYSGRRNYSLLHGEHRLGIYEGTQLPIKVIGINIDPF